MSRGSTRRSAILLVVATLAGCGGGSAVPETKLAVRLEMQADACEFGKAFDLTVRRIWEKTLVPEAWQDAALAPLVLRSVGVERVEDDYRVMETRRFRAYAFAQGEVEVPPLVFRARPTAGGAERTAQGEGRRIRVKSALDAANPGPVELPAGPLAPPLNRRRLLLVAIPLLVALMLTVYLLRRLSVRRRDGERAAAPFRRARSRFAALSKALPTDRPGIDRFHVEACDALRDLIVAHLRIPATEMTSFEIARAVGDERLDGASRATLRSFLAACDRVKFGRVPAGGDECRAVLESGEAVIAAIQGASLAGSGSATLAGARS